MPLRPSVGWFVTVWPARLAHCHLVCGSRRQLPREGGWEREGATHILLAIISSHVLLSSVAVVAAPLQGCSLG